METVPEESPGTRSRRRLVDGLAVATAPCTRWRRATGWLVARGLLVITVGRQQAPEEHAPSRPEPASVAVPPLAPDMPDRTTLRRSPS